MNHTGTYSAILSQNDDFHAAVGDMDIHKVISPDHVRYCWLNYSEDYRFLHYFHYVCPSDVTSYFTHNRGLMQGQNQEYLIGKRSPNNFFSNALTLVGY